MVGLNAEPTSKWLIMPAAFKRFFLRKKMVGLNGLEASTSRLSGGRSNLLSYKPIFWWR